METEKVSIWKRVGGWLRKSHQPVTSGKPVNLDAEGLLVDANEESNTEEPNATPIIRSKKEQQAIAMEEGFGRLVEALEAINENVTQQRQASADLKGLLADLPQLTTTLPQAVQAQRDLLQQIAEQFRDQSQRHQQLAETFQQIPEISQSQLDRLEEITQQLASSRETETAMADSCRRIDQAMQETNECSRAQQDSLATVSHALQNSQKSIHELLTRQNRRMAWLTGIAVGAAILLVAAAATALWLMWKGTPPA